MLFRIHQPRTSLPIAATMMAATLIATLPLDAHARRFSSSSNTSHSSSHTSSHSEESNAQKAISGVNVTVRHRSRETESETDEKTSPNSVNVAPAASDQKTATPDDRTQEEANRKAQQELIAQQKAQKLAAIKAEKEAEAQERARLQDALERQCVIKPVMTDDEITTCKTVWR